MGVKVPEMKYSFWCERDIRGTNGTKREKYGEKYSSVNAARKPRIDNSQLVEAFKATLQKLSNVLMLMVADN